MKKNDKSNIRSSENPPTLSFQTSHLIREGDARDLSFLPSESVHCVITNPPYADLIHYPEGPGQLGNMASYELFLDELDKVWAECLRVLVPGARVACVVGDVCISRRAGGRHHVLPLSSDITVRARRLGFDALTPIRWLKVANIRLEASKSSRFLGRPNLPNGIVKNDLEHILFLRKPGGYRKPSAEQERLSFIATEEYSQLFSPIWSDVTGQQRTSHPAPYPVEIPRRLIRMFSFSGDTYWIRSQAPAARPLRQSRPDAIQSPSNLSLRTFRLSRAGSGNRASAQRSRCIVLRRPLPPQNTSRRASHSVDRPAVRRLSIHQGLSPSLV